MCQRVDRLIAATSDPVGLPGRATRPSDALSPFSQKQCELKARWNDPSGA